MPDLDKLLQELRYTETHAAHNAKMDEIAALGEAIIPELVEMMHRERYVFDIPVILAKIGRVSSPILLKFFLSEFVEFNLLQNIASAMQILKDEAFFEPLLPYIYSDDERRAKATVRILGSLNDERIIAPMTGILQDYASGPRQRARAIELLGLSPVAKSTTPLIKQYVGDQELNEIALLALYRLDGEIELEQIQKFFQNPSNDLLPAFLYTVADKIDQRLSSLLLELLDNVIKEAKIQKSKRDFRGLPYGLLWAIGELKIEAAVDSLMICVDIERLGPQTAIQTIAKIGSDYALERLIGKLGRGFAWWDERRYGHDCLVENIASFGMKVFEPLTKIILDRTESIFLRSHAAEVLCHLAEPQVVEFFLELCASPDAIVLCQSDSAYNLYRLNDKRLAQPVINLVRDGKMHSQYAANALALADTEDLIFLLKDEKFSVRESVIIALGMKKDKEAVLPLIAMLPQHDYWVVKSLAEIGDSRATEALVNRIGKSHLADLYAVEVGGELAIKPLLKRLKEKDKSGEELIVRALWKLGVKPELEPSYKAWHKEKDEAKKQELLFRLAGLKDERVIPELTNRLYLQKREPYPDAASHAARLLSNYSSEKTTKILQSRLLEIPRDSGEWLNLIQEIIDQWAKNGKDSLDLLLELLDAPSLQVRMVAISGLNLHWDRERILAALMPLLLDKTRIPNANTRICDRVAFKLHVYDIKEAQEVFEEWQSLSKSDFFRLG